MRRLFPHPADAIDLREAYDVERPAPAGRPWVSLCMVSSLDGSTVVDTTSRGLSNPTDQALLLTLRSFADVILVGAATVRHENYGPPKRADQRIAVVSRSGRFDFDSPLFASGRAIVVLPEDAPQVPVPSVRAGTDTLDLPAALGLLHTQFGANVVQAEGGATLNGLLAAGDFIDELNLTVSPQISGGDGQRLTVGAPALARRMHLAHVLEDDGFLFTRYVRMR
ncbi:MAG: dihydrofolate reductase family protein [Actinomycetota bacterium]|nr:dihydrofolate reductase family protein [Actinomycetota bacterium]